MEIKPAPKPLNLHGKEQMTPEHQIQRSSERKSEVGLERNRNLVSEPEVEVPLIANPEIPKETTLEPTKITPVNPPIEQKEPTKPRKVPTELKKLRTHNNVGLKEGIKTIDEGGRVTRNSKKILD